MAARVITFVFEALRQLSFNANDYLETTEIDGNVGDNDGTYRNNHDNVCNDPDNSYNDNDGRSGNNRHKYSVNYKPDDFGSNSHTTPLGQRPIGQPTPLKS